MGSLMSHALATGMAWAISVCVCVCVIPVDATVTFRYLNVSSTGIPVAGSMSSCWALYEILFYGTSGQHVTIQHAVATSSYSATYVATNVFDKSLSSAWAPLNILPAFPCNFMSPAGSMWITVDMGSVMTLGAAYIYQDFTDVDSTTSVQFSISDDSVSWTAWPQVQANASQFTALFSELPGYVPPVASSCFNQLGTRTTTSATTSSGTQTGTISSTGTQTGTQTGTSTTTGTQTWTQTGTITSTVTTWTTTYIVSGTSSTVTESSTASTTWTKTFTLSSTVSGTSSTMTERSQASMTSRPYSTASTSSSTVTASAAVSGVSSSAFAATKVSSTIPATTFLDWRASFAGQKASTVLAVIVGLVILEIRGF